MNLIRPLAVLVLGTVLLAGCKPKDHSTDATTATPAPPADTAPPPDASPDTSEQPPPPNG